MIANQISRARIVRPGAPAPNPSPEEDVTPISVMGGSLLTGAVSYLEILTASEAFAAAGTLTAFETIALVGTMLSGAGAVALFTFAVGALVFPELRSQLGSINKMIGVTTSPGGLTMLAGMEAMGYSSQDALKGGELGKYAFTAVSLGKVMEDGIKNWKEAASAANNIKDIINDTPRSQVEDSPFGDAPSPDDIRSEPNPFAEGYMSLRIPDEDGNVRTVIWGPDSPGMGEIGDNSAEHTGDSSAQQTSGDGERPDPPGPGEVGGGGGEQGDPGEKPGPPEGGGGDEHDGGGGGDGD